jgi:hypothetical protein
MRKFIVHLVCGLSFGLWLFTGTNLALKIVRISDDDSFPVEMRYFLHTRVEGEDGVWR